MLEGVPKEATPAYQKILLYVDANTYQVRRVLLLDAQGNRNRFDFVSVITSYSIHYTKLYDVWFRSVMPLSTLDRGRRSSDR